MKKIEFGVEIKTLHDFTYFLMYEKAFSNVVSNQNKTNLTWHIHVQRHLKLGTKHLKLETLET